ncbi:SDR family NAD(P)-dependent oxidoreductase [Lichenihabitans psoromatis]|uniref:SDR family NAD(P)-dependent oxidoreductase n=1 Tax=Lichenihabitans psoromatis TaxID=2528642 RepID=UPI001FDFF6CE|nr:SDR family NAD(P)-dependent oxidoreductase [Lichenihabitans psoromatis]
MSDLMRNGATIIIGVRNVDKGKALSAALSSKPGGGKIEVLPLDIASMESVRGFAAVVGEAHPALQLLVNNAGAWFSERGETKEGHELTLATNVLGPHLLTSLLLPQLHTGKPARIVNTTSGFAGSYDVGDQDWKRRKYTGFKAYSQSKQALRMMTWKLAQRLEGSGVVANTVSPGFVKTELMQNTSGLVTRLIRMISFMADTRKGCGYAVVGGNCPGDG